MPTISVIVPVYNVEKYLRCCVDSILAQTFTDIEVLLVDDGSTDGSGAICDEYAQKDSRVRVFHKANGGVSSARNLGLDNTRGGYIMFVDSDDKVAPTICETLLSYAADGIMPICAHYKWVDGKTFAVTSNHQQTFYPVKEFDIGATPSPWCKLYEKRLIGRCLRFREDFSFMEDALFNCEYYRFIHGFMVIESPLYYYRILPNSLSHGRYVPHFGETIVALKAARVELGKSLGFSEETILDKGYYTNLFYSMCTAMSNNMHIDAPGTWIQKMRRNGEVLRSEEFKKVYPYRYERPKDFAKRYIRALELSYHTGSYFWLWLVGVPGKIKETIKRKK